MSDSTAQHNHPVGTSIMPREGFDGFRRLSREAFVAHEITTPTPDTFGGFIQPARLGEVPIAAVTSDGHTVRRTKAHIANSDSSVVKVTLQLLGAAQLRQGHTCVQLAPGDVVAYDTARPYEINYPGAYAVLMLMVPRERLAPLRRPHQPLEVHHFARHGMGSCLSSFLRELGHNLDLGPPGARALGNTAVELVARTLHSELQNRSGDSCYHRDLHQEVITWIDDHLADPDLSPTSIADAHHISLSHLHAIFRTSGETVSALIRSKRLTRAQRGLRDLRNADTPVTAIAKSVGFIDSAHFSRLYKAQFGRPPRAERNDALFEASATLH